MNARTAKPASADTPAKHEEVNVGISDHRLYTRQQLALVFNKKEEWVERTIQHPQHPTTRKPLCRCNVCEAEFSFPDPVQCPKCKSLDVDMVDGAPFQKVGGRALFSGYHLRLWIEARARSQLRENWQVYHERLEEVRHERRPSPGTEQASGLPPT